MKMNRLILLSLTLVLVLGLVESFEFSEKELETEESLQSMYQRWQAHHNLDLPPPGDRNKRYNSFKANAKLVHSTNKMNKSYKLGMNRFADLSLEEFKSTYTGAKVSKELKASPQGRGNRTFSQVDHQSLPDSVDWREKNAVTCVKNQGGCGSCWTFAVTSVVEGIIAIKQGQLVDLSTQELLDCSESWNFGCKGGSCPCAMTYIQNKGIVPDKDYPYEHAQATCRAPTANKFFITGHVNVHWESDEQMMKIISQQPLLSQIGVAEDFFLYKEGVYDGACTKEVVHAVVLTGYGTSEEGIPYWTMKNSWGPEWGEKGYMRLIRGTPDPHGKCAVNEWNVYPEINSTNAQSAKQDL